MEIASFWIRFYELCQCPNKCAVNGPLCIQREGFTFNILFLSNILKDSTIIHVISYVIICLLFL